MERDYRASNSSVRERESLSRSTSDNSNKQATSSDFVLQWGNRKRLRCMKFQAKDKDKDKDKDDCSGPNLKNTTARVDRRVVKADKDSSNHHHHHHPASTNGYLNLRHRPSSPPPPPQRVLRNSENSTAMRGHTNGSLRGFSSPDRTAHDKRNANNHVLHHHHQNNHHHHHVNNHHNEGNKSAASSETAHDSKKGGGGSSSGSGDAAPPVWPPKFVIALTNKEKEEDFFIFKGSKLPQRPKKRAKMIQRTVNLVCPGTWLCDLTLERYEVREKKISKKRPRGLKAMGNMDSDSE